MKKGTRRKHGRSCMCRCGGTERNTLGNLSGRHLERSPKNAVSWVRKKKTQGEKLVRQFLNKQAISSHESRLYDSKCQVANGLWIEIDGHATCLPSLQKDNSKASHTVRLCFSCPRWSQTYCLLGLWFTFFLSCLCLQGSPSTQNLHPGPLFKQEFKMSQGQRSLN